MMNHVNILVAENEPAVSRTVPAMVERAVIVDDLGNGLVFAAASPALHRFRAQVARLAVADDPLLLTNPRAVDSEIVARLLHRLSPQGHRPFVKLGCNGVAPEVLERELFGYEKGAFPAAARKRPGLLEMNRRGTLFLEGLGAIPHALQRKLAYFAEERQFGRLGGRELLCSDLRAIVTTRCSNPEAVFRPDFLNRFNPFNLSLPALPQQQAEIPVLLNHLTQVAARMYNLHPAPLTERVLEACRLYDWPGGFWELCSFARRWMVMRDEALALSGLETRLRRHNVRTEAA